MQLIFGKESKPADAILLVLAKLGVDGNRDFVRNDLAPVQQLRQEVALFLATLEELFRKSRRVGQARLSDESVARNAWKRGPLTSSGTILTRLAKTLVAVARTSSFGSLMRPRTGTTRKMTYGSAFMSSFCTMSAHIH